MKTRSSLCGLGVVILVAMLAGCAELGSGNLRDARRKAEAVPPTRVASVSQVPVDQSTYHYKVNIYPGLDERFNPNPKLTLQEYNELGQLDWYCAKQVDELSGEFQEMLKQGVALGVLEGVFGAIGYRLGFGNLIKPSDYFAAIGLTGFGGGLANGWITYRLMLNTAHGYCMTGMVYKADELEGKLRRVFITPLYVGKAKLPHVSTEKPPQFSGQNGRQLPLPPR